MAASIILPLLGPGGRQTCPVLHHHRSPGREASDRGHRGVGHRPGSASRPAFCLSLRQAQQGCPPKGGGQSPPAWSRNLRNAVFVLHKSFFKKHLGSIGPSRNWLCLARPAARTLGIAKSEATRQVGPCKLALFGARALRGAEGRLCRAELALFSSPPSLSAQKRGKLGSFASLASRRRGAGPGNWLCLANLRPGARVSLCRAKQACPREGRGGNLGRKDWLCLAYLAHRRCLRYPQIPHPPGGTLRPTSPAPQPPHLAP